MSHLSTLRTLLAEIPELHFDLRQYLLATRHAAQLEESFCQFKSYFSNSVPERDYRAQIVYVLRESIAHLVPAYSDLAEVEQFLDIPFCDKNSLRTHSGSFVRHDLAPQDLCHATTSGTTGAPVAIVYDAPFYYEIVHLTIRKIVHTAGIRLFEDYPIFSICIDNRRNGIDCVAVDPIGQVGHTLLLHIDESNAGTLDRLFHFIETLKPAVVVARPSIFEVLIAHAVSLPRKRRCSPLCVVSAGSFLSDAVRQETEELFGAKVFVSYGLTEFCRVASECCEQNGLHVDETTVLVEVIDWTGQPIDDGSEGEIVLSSLANTAMPLLRYRTGDIGALDQVPCPCGRAGPRIVGIQGRQAFHYQFADGALVHPGRFNCLFWLFPIADFRMVQTSFDRLEVLVEPGASCRDADLLARQIQRHIQQMLPCPVEVVVRTTIFGDGHQFERHLTRVKGDRRNWSAESSPWLGRVIADAGVLRHRNDRA